MHFLRIVSDSSEILVMKFEPIINIAKFQSQHRRILNTESKEKRFHQNSKKIEFVQQNKNMSGGSSTVARASDVVSNSVAKGIVTAVMGIAVLKVAPQLKLWRKQTLTFNCIYYGLGMTTMSLVEHATTLLVNNGQPTLVPPIESSAAKGVWLGLFVTAPQKRPVPMAIAAVVGPIICVAFDQLIVRKY